MLPCHASSCAEAGWLLLRARHARVPATATLGRLSHSRSLTRPAAQERREQNRRATETRNNDLLRCVCCLWPVLLPFGSPPCVSLHGDHRTLASSSASMERGEDHFRLREAREREAEAALLAAAEADRAARALRERAALQAQLISSELDRRQRELERAQRHVQKVIEESPEIRELKVKLQAAEMNYTREQQRRDALAVAAAAVQEDKAFAVSVGAALKEADAADAAIAAERLAFQLSRREVLQSQMYEHAQAAWAARAEVAADRVAMDAAAAAALADADAEAAARQQRRADEAAWVHGFLLERAELSAAKVAAEVEEDARVAAYQAALHARSEGLAAKKQARMDEEARVFAKLAAEAAAAQRAREQMEDLIARLHFEEKEERLRAIEAARRARAAQAKAEMLQAYEDSVTLRAAREASAKAEAAAFRELLLARLAEDDRLEQMADAKRRMKLLEHKREVERLAAIKAAMIAEAASADARADAAVQAREQVDAGIVAAERQRLLREHASRLAAYLPKGVAATAEDLALINSLSGLQL